jgi:hypothetical protein
VGVFNAISSGLLIYAALVDLLAEDFLSEEAQHTLRGKDKKMAFFYVILGAGKMITIHTITQLLTQRSRYVRDRCLCLSLARPALFWRVAVAGWEAYTSTPVRVTHGKPPTRAPSPLPMPGYPRNALRMIRYYSGNIALRSTESLRTECMNMVTVEITASNITISHFYYQNQRSQSFFQCAFI